MLKESQKNLVKTKNVNLLILKKYSMFKKCLSIFLTNSKKFIILSFELSRSNF